MPRIRKFALGKSARPPPAQFVLYVHALVTPSEVLLMDTEGAIDRLAAFEASGVALRADIGLPPHGGGAEAHTLEAGEQLRIYAAASLPWRWADGPGACLRSGLTFLPALTATKLGLTWSPAAMAMRPLLEECASVAALPAGESAVYKQRVRAEAVSSG